MGARKLQLQLTGGRPFARDGVYAQGMHENTMLHYIFVGRLGIHPAQVVCRALHGNTILRYGTQANGRTPGTGCVPRGGVFYIAFFCWAYTPRRREPCFARVQVYIMASLHYTITFGRSSSGFFFHAFFLCCAVRAK